MIALIQRVSEAEVRVAGECTGRIGQGLLALIGVRRADTDADAQRLAERIVGYRVFADEAGRMNRSLADVGGELLLVPQFTLAADTRSGTRAGFQTAAAPELASRLFDGLATHCRERAAQVACGVFGADMRVSLVNCGPVTFWLES